MSKLKPPFWFDCGSLLAAEKLCEIAYYNGWAMSPSFNRKDDFRLAYIDRDLEYVLWYWDSGNFSSLPRITFNEAWEFFNIKRVA